MSVTALLSICFLATAGGAAGPLQCLMACEKEGDLLTDQTIGQVEVACTASETITIISALYGRLDSSTCPTVTINNPAYSTECSAATAPAKVSALCDGKESCTVNAAVEVFGDPCPKTEKYLTVCFVCTSPSVNVTALEEKVKTLCDTVAALETCFSDKTSTECPPAAAGKVSITDAIKSLEEPTVFNCAFYGGDFSTTATLSPYTCDVNEGSVVDPATGIFTAAKQGKYRLTFMARSVPLNKKKVFCLLIKTSSGTESKIGRSVAQTKVGSEQEQITTTINIIHQLQPGETVHVYIQVRGGSKINGDDNLPQQVTFTGEFLRS